MTPSPPPPAPAKESGGGGALRLTFTKAQRVLDRRDFQRIQGRGSKLGGSTVLVLAMPQVPPRAKARLGVTVSKKCGGSVQRTRIKRVIREAFRLDQQHFPAGWDFVVIAREKALHTSLEGMRLELKNALNKLGQMKQPPRPAVSRSPT